MDFFNSDLDLNDEPSLSFTFNKLCVFIYLGIYSNSGVLYNITERSALSDSKKLDLNVIEIQIILIFYKGYTLLECCSPTAWRRMETGTKQSKKREDPPANNEKGFYTFPFSSRCEYPRNICMC